MVLDLIAVVLITYGFYKGYTRGLIKTVVDTLSILIALVITFKFSPMLIDYLGSILNFHPGVEFIMGVLFVFFFVLLLLRFIADKVENLFRAVGVNFINQIAGGALLGLVFAFGVGALLILATNLRLLPASVMDESRFYGHLVNVGNEGWVVFDAFKSIFAEFWAKFMDTLDQVKDRADQRI